MSVIINGDTGITTPAETVQGALTTTGNTILGDATTDTLNVGAGGLVKDASGNVGIGTSSPLAKLNVSRTDAALIGLFSGTTKGTRIGANSTYSYIEGVDTTGSASYQPLMIGGADVRFTTSDTEQARITAAGLFQFNSGYGSAATAYGCRAWVNFNGTGTVAIRASGNVSSITDNGVGDYTVNFTTAMADGNYAPVISSNNFASNTSVSNNNDYGSARLVGSYRFAHLEAAALADASALCVSIFR